MQQTHQTTQPAISTNSGTNKQLSTSSNLSGGSGGGDFQSSSSFSIRSNNTQPKEYVIPTLINEQIEPHGGVKFKIPVYQSQPNMVEFVEGAKLIVKSEDLATRKLTFRETFAKNHPKTTSSNNSETQATINTVQTTTQSTTSPIVDSSTTNSQISHHQPLGTFQTQFRLKPLPKANLDLCDESSPFINLKIEKKPATKVERVPIKLRHLNKFEDLTVTNASNRFVLLNKFYSKIILTI